MNKERRAHIASLAVRIDDIVGELESLKDDEQEYLDNMPESFQNGERGQGAEEAVSSLDDAIAGLADVSTALEDAAK